MPEINDFRGTFLIRYADGAPAWHHPKKIGMMDLKSPLV